MEMEELSKEIATNLMKATESENLLWTEIPKDKEVKHHRFALFSGLTKEKHFTASDGEGSKFEINICCSLASGAANWKKDDTYLYVIYDDTALDLTNYAKNEINNLGNLIISKFCSDFTPKNLQNRLKNISGNILKLNRDEKIVKIQYENSKGNLC